jgi:hypothetical protein
MLLHPLSEVVYLKGFPTSRIQGEFTTLAYIIIPGVIAALQVAVLTEPITMVKGKDTSTGGASLASIQPREQSLINLLCERVASAADLFVAWAKWSKLRSAR